MQPLQGMRVVDFGRYVAGPWCAQLLQGYGAEVLRVERPDGGEDRWIYPLGSDHVGAYFLECNRGKRSLALKTTSPRGRAVVARLVKAADVVVANLPDDALEAMGVDWVSVHAANPRAVLATATTFGTTGPYAGRLGFDGIGQAMSGAVHLTGTPEEPYKSFVPWVDFTTGAVLASGVLAALLERERSGEGQRVEASLLGAALATAGCALTEQAVDRPDRVATGNRHPAAGPSDIVATLDGRVMVQVVGNPMFARWCEAMSRLELVEDERFVDDTARGRNGDALSAVLAAWASTRTTEGALAELAAAGVPAGPVLSPQQVLDDPHIATMLLDHAKVPGVPDAVPVAQHPIRLSASDVRLGHRAPAVGEHTDAVLTELGYSPAEIVELRADGAVG